LIWRNVGLADWFDADANRIETVFSKLLDRIQNKAHLMGAMMARLRVDPVDAARIRGGSALGSAWRRCLTCRKGKECTAWLEAPASSYPQAPPFCPNADFLAEAGVQPASWPAPSPLSIVGANGRSGDGPA
jgi:hypothetical protein